MEFWTGLFTLLSRFGTIWIFLALIVGRTIVTFTPKGSSARSRFRLSAGLFLLHVFLVAAAHGLAQAHSRIAGDVTVLTGLIGTLASVSLAGVIIFEGVVRRISPDVPQILLDVVTTIAAFIAMMRASSALGVDLSGVIATSAVLTAVIGLSLQDTLGNVVGGLALQLDSSIKVGDWVKVGDVSGRVVEIRWRYTAIETRNWETVIIPNSVLTKSQALVLGRRSGKPIQWRRWVYFQVDFRHAPNEVIDVVEKALRAQPLPNVAADPPPNCIVMDFGDSAAKYAVRYWLTDLAVDDPTDSLVRNRIFYALSRAHLTLSIPAQAVFVTNDDQERAEHKRAVDFAKRVAALQRVELFRDLTDEDRAELAENLHRAPFAQGETMTREGAAGHHLYAILSGRVSVRVGGTGEGNEVASLGPGDFFGEMALLAGEKRRASCVAVTDVECYRLDAEAFRKLLAHRPDLAENVAKVLVEREQRLNAVREKVDAADLAARTTQDERALVARIRSFFELD